MRDGLSQHPPTGRGFTLYELILVALIIGIVASIAAPRFANAIANQRCDAAARRIVVDLSLAQRQARSSSASQSVTFDVDSNGYHLVDMTGVLRAGEDYAVSLSDEPYCATITRASLGGDAEIIFDGYGAPDSGGAIVLRVGDQMRLITIDAETGTAAVSRIASDPLGGGEADPGEPVVPVGPGVPSGPPIGL